MTTASTVRTGVCVLLTLGLAQIVACDAPAETRGLFTPEQARDMALAFHRDWMARDPAAVSRHCAEPFSFRGRIWKTRAEIAANLSAPIADGRVTSQVGDRPEVRVHTREDLLDGANVTGLSLPAERGARGTALTALGIEGPDAYLVRLHAPQRAGWLLVVGAGEATRLEVLAFLP